MRAELSCNPAVGLDPPPVSTLGLKLAVTPYEGSLELGGWQTHRPAEPSLGQKLPSSSGVAAAQCRGPEPSDPSCVPPPHPPHLWPECHRDETGWCARWGGPGGECAAGDVAGLEGVRGASEGEEDFQVGGWKPPAAGTPGKG